MSARSIVAERWDARTLFVGETLPFPPIPGAVEAQLAQVADLVFATRMPAERPFDLAANVRALMSADPEDAYCLVGFDGYGINNWAVHYFVGLPGLLLLLQLPWGGAYMNRDKTRARVEAGFRFAADLQAKMEYVAEEGLTPRRFRLAVAITEFGESKWAYVRGRDRYEAIRWSRIAGVRADVDAAIARLLDGEFRS